jgi:dTDP-glucose 4,6-dehydratase/UDP-glucuronate decarboxylase
VVGGKGFLGTYFVHVLSSFNRIFNNPVEILVLDNLITAKDKTNFHDPNVKFIEKDVSKNFTIDVDPDYIIHAASIASPPFYRKFPIETVDVNYQGTRNLLEIARKKEIKAMLYLSSSEIYGDPTVVPTPESYWGHVSSTGPRACYDESKRLAETISILYHEQYKIPIKIARPFNVYGPFLNLNDGRIIPDFMKNAIKNSEIIIHSDGTPTRSFCYITDAMRAFFRILLLAPSGSIWNVGNDEEISVRGVAETIRKIINKPIQIKIEKSPDPNYITDNPQRRCPDLSKMKRLGSYDPQIRLEDGIKRLYEWYLGNLE